MTSKIEGVIKKGQNVNVSKLRKFSPLKNVFKNSYRKLIKGCVKATRSCAMWNQVFVIKPQGSRIMK